MYFGYERSDSVLLRASGEIGWNQAACTPLFPQTGSPDPDNQVFLGVTATGCSMPGPPCGQAAWNPWVPLTRV